MAKRKSKAAQAPTKKRTYRQPKKELDAVQKEIRQVRNPVYAFNRKIKEAPSKYKQGKIKKQRQAYLQGVDQRLNELVERRKELRATIREFQDFKNQRATAKRRATTLERKIKEAADDQDLVALNRLNEQLLKQLGEIDRLDELLGAKLDKTNIKDFNREEEEDGSPGFELDARSPYAVWEAVRQLKEDLKSEALKYIIINGRRYSRNNPIEILAEASTFWISIKRRTDGTPYVNRYLNLKTQTVKYKYFSGI